MNTIKNLAIVETEGLQLLEPFSYHNSFEGQYMVTTKIAGGFTTTKLINASSMIEAFRSFKAEKIMNIAWITPKGYSLTIFNKSGKKIRIAQELLVDMEVADINADKLSDTCLGSAEQYKAVNAKTWASFAYRMND